MVDVFIIGGGPAGSATALSMTNNMNDSGIRVTQVCGPKPMRDAIGETIPPAATDHMRKLGVLDLINNDSHLPCPGSHSVWGSDTPGFNDFFFTPIGKGYHLNRSVFNQQLISEAQKRGVVMMEDSKLLKVESEHSGYNLTIVHKGAIINKHADFVVDATGIQAKVARSLGVARNQYDSVISACHIFDLTQQVDKKAHTLVCAVDHGWWYGTQLPNNRVLLSLCTDKETLKNEKLTSPEVWFDALQKSGWFYENCSAQFSTRLQQPESIDTRVAPSAILSCVVGDNWLAVGDAASSYDSMTSAGITKALEQGLKAGSAVADLIKSNNKQSLKDYQQSVFDAFNQYLRLHQELYCSEQRFPESSFWHRREFNNN